MKVHPNSVAALLKMNAARKLEACPKCGGRYNKYRHCKPCRRKKARWLGYDGKAIKPGWLVCQEFMGRGYGKAIEAKYAKPKRTNVRTAPFSCDDEMVGEMLKANASKVNLKASWAGIVWSSRYWMDDNFRASEIARTQAKEARRWRCANDGTLTGRVVQSLFAQAKDCHWCRMPMHPRNKTMDHLVPLSKGGVHGLSNVVVACLSCNVRRGASIAA